MRQWLDICAVNEVPEQGARVVRRGVAGSGNDIALFRNGAGEIFALLDRCPHKGGPLSQGMVFADRVACPLHGWNIFFKNGKAAAPDEGETLTFAVSIDQGRVLLDAEQVRTRLFVTATTAATAA